MSHLPHFALVARWLTTSARPSETCHHRSVFDYDNREYKGDAVSARISGKPLALASALEKLQQGARRIPMQVSPSVAPLAQVNPLSAFGGIAKLFSTHPPTEERIARLRAMAEHA